MTPVLLAAVVGMPALWTDGTYLHPEVPRPGRDLAASVAAYRRPAGARGPSVGDRENFWAIDYTVDPPPYNFYLTPATCRYVGEHCYIFVEDSEWGVHFDQAAVDSLAEALEDSTPSGPGGIMEKLIGAMGPMPDVLDGDPKVYFLVLDIRDGFDPEQGGAYIAGFFSPWNEYPDDVLHPYHSNEVEMMYIDCYPSHESDAPFTCSHELVHLIYFGIEPYSSEDLWVLENQAQTGPYICGYPAFQIVTFLEAGGVTPVGWTEFTDDLRYVAGYGAGFLFFSYLFENYGGADFIYDSMHSTRTGLAGVADAIQSATGSRPDMGAVLRDWMLACWIDDPTIDDGRYGWQGFSIAAADTEDPGNRRGLDYRAIVGAGQFVDPAHPVGAFCSNGYRIEDSAGGSFRAGATGVGSLLAYFLPSAGGEPVPVQGAQGGDVAIQLPVDGTALLLCSSFDGFDLEAAAGSVAGSGGAPAVFPQPCLGTLYFQFVSSGQPVTLSVMTLSGQCVESVTLDGVPSGEAVVPYEGASELASGVYFYRLAQGGAAWTGRFAVVR